MLQMGGRGDEGKVNMLNVDNPSPLPQVTHRMMAVPYPPETEKWKSLHWENSQTQEKGLTIVTLGGSIRKKPARSLYKEVKCCQPPQSMH